MASGREAVVTAPSSHCSFASTLCWHFLWWFCHFSWTENLLGWQYSGLASWLCQAHWGQCALSFHERSILAAVTGIPVMSDFPSYVTPSSCLSCQRHSHAWCIMLKFLLIAAAVKQHTALILMSHCNAPAKICMVILEAISTKISTLHANIKVKSWIVNHIDWVYLTFKPLKVDWSELAPGYSIQEASKSWQILQHKQTVTNHLTRPFISGPECIISTPQEPV